MWWPNGNGWGGGLLMLLTMLIFWGGLILFGVWAVKQFSTGPGNDRPDPKTILEERFARGEIDPDRRGAQGDAIDADLRAGRLRAHFELPPLRGRLRQLDRLR